MVVEKTTKIKRKHSRKGRRKVSHRYADDRSKATLWKKTKPRIDFERRNHRGSQCSYVVLEGRRVVACTKIKYHAALLAWALAVEDILIDQKTMAFVSAVTGLLGLRGKQLRDALSRHGDRQARGT